MKKFVLLVLFLVFAIVFSMDVEAYACSGSCESGSQCNAAGTPAEGKMWSCRLVSGSYQCVQDPTNDGGSRCYLSCNPYGWFPCGCDVSGCESRCENQYANSPGHHTRTEICSNCGQEFTCGCDIPQPPYCGDSKCNDGSGKTCEPDGSTKDMKCVNNVYTGDLSNGVCRTSGDYACTYCGDGIKQSGAGEQCDDGNRVNGDGCSATCEIEEDEPYCGDSICNDGSGKTCEPNGLTEDMSCQSEADIYLPEGTCRTEGEYACTYCGDSIVQSGAGEECDDGNDIDDDDCSNTCKAYQIPEFNTLTFGVAIIIAGLGLVILRRR